MRRISPAFALAALLLAPSTALAQRMHHRMAVNEVLLSSGGDDAVQYVELHDVALSGEPFPNDYVLGVYDVDGNLLDSVPLAIDGGGGNVTDWYVATTAADGVFGPDGQDELTVALPAEGQVCFELSTGNKFSCVAWGCVNTVLTGMTVGISGRGASPPDGMSLSRQADGSYQVANPTPDAANDAGDATPACATDPDAGPGAIDAGTGEPDGGLDNPDGGTGNGGDGSASDDDSGCGCRQSSSGGLSGAFLLMGAFLLLRRRSATGTGTRT